MKKFLRTSLRRKTPSPDRKSNQHEGPTLTYDIKEKELPKLHKAAWNGDLSKIKQIAKKGDLNQLDKENRSALHLACAQGHTDVVQYLTSNKAKLNVCDNGQQSPLMKAVQSDSVQCVRVLLEHNADPNLIDKDGMTALHLAAQSSSADSVSLLLDSGAMVNATDKNACTPLHLATSADSDDVVELLLHKDADVNATDQNQRTPLMLACQADQIGIVKLLLESKADTEIKDSKGWSAADHAVMKAHHGCSHLINEHSAAHRAKPVSRQGGMFRSPGAPIVGAPENGHIGGYGLGGPAADAGEDVLSQEEESVSRMSELHDSWGDTSEADDTFSVPRKQQMPSGVNLAKYVKGSDTESASTTGAGKSRIPRAISKESVASISSKQGSNIDFTDSKIPRLQQDKRSASPVLTPRSEPPHTPRSTADTEADSTVNFSDGDDVIEDLSLQEYNPGMPDTGLGDQASQVQSAKPANDPDMADEKKNKQSALAAELGLDDFDDSQWDTSIIESEHDEPKSPTVAEYPTVKRNTQSVTEDTPVEFKVNVSKDQDDGDFDWDSDEDLLPSHSSNRRGGSAASTPRGVSLDMSPRPVPLSKTSPKATEESDTVMFLGKGPAKQTTPVHKDDEVSGFDSDEETEETESEWEKERKAEKERKRIEQELKEEQDREKERMLQWERDEQERKQREEQEVKAALEREKEQQKRVEMQRMRQDEEEHRREEEERRKQTEKLKEIERQREEERRQEEKRKAAQKKLEDDRKRKDDEERRRVAEEELRNAEIRQRLDEERREAERKRKEDQKRTEDHRKDMQRKLEEEKQKLEEDMLERERKREIERKQLEEKYNKSVEERLAADDRATDLDDSFSESWSAQPSPVPVRASSGLGYSTSGRSPSPKRAYTPASNNLSWKRVLTEDADGLSYSDTDTEGDFNHSPYSSTPLPLHSISSPTTHSATDPGVMLQMQESLRDHRRLIDRERSARITLETKVKKLEMDKTELYRKIDSLSECKSTLEEEKVNLEAKIRNLNYTLTEETDRVKSAELMLEKTKEQLDRKEQQYLQELESRQKSELSSRTLEMELKSSLNTIKQLQEDNGETRKELAQERSARIIQEQLSQDHTKIHEALQQEAEQFQEEKAEIFTRLEAADENRKSALDHSDKLKAELYGLKMELERVRMRYKDDQGMLAMENEEMNNRVDELKNDIRLNEEALAHATMTYNAHLGAAKAENNLLVTNYEKEKAEKDKLQQEVKNLNTRVTTLTHELERAQQTKSDVERSSQRDRDELQRANERLEMELSNQRDSLQSKSQSLGAAESRVKSLEHELHIATLNMTEKSGQLISLQRELDQRKSMLESVEKELMKDKEEKIKMEAKLESANDRLASTQNELSQMKYESNGSQGKLDNLLTSMKTDYDKNREMLQEKNAMLNQMVDRLNNDLQRLEEKNSKQEQHIGQLQQELADVIKKLSTAEVMVESSSKECAKLEREKESHANIHQQLIDSEKDRAELGHRTGDLQSRLEQAEKALQDTTQELVKAQELIEKKRELEENMHQLEIEKTKLLSNTDHDTKKISMLEQDLQDSQKVRGSLEALVANLKSANIHLEDKLSEEVAARSLYAREAEDHKGLWENEVKSRSKLGLRMAQLERARTGVEDQVSEGKMKIRKALELKRQADAKVEQEVQKNKQQQKEINMLKAALKSAKKRLKDLEAPEMRIKSIQADMDHERRTFDDTIGSLRRQNEEINHQLQLENDMRASVEASHRQMQNELSSTKNMKRENEKLQKAVKKLQDQLSKVKSSLGNEFIEKDEMDKFKQSVESQARQEVNKKLEEVNNYLEEQAQARERLDQIRDANEIRMKSDHEKQLNDMRTDIARMKAANQESLVQKETHEAEAQRFKELYESELRMREKLTDQLERATEKMTDAKAQLSMERQRSRHLAENSPDLGGSFMQPGMGTASVDPITQKVRNELDRSIARHLGSLDTSPGVMQENMPNNWDSKNGSLSPLDKANSQYMSVLRKNYFI
ncbi:uncharacterized protein LOC100371645 [Saccoglossus kowalevskii]